MRYDVPAALAELASWQDGALSRKQVLAAGVSANLAARRLERGRWQVLFRGVYAVYGGTPDRETWLWAAVLRAGPGAVLSQRTAAELHGLADAPSAAIFVTIPSTRRVDARGIVVRVSARAAAATQPNRYPPRTSVEETVLDLAQAAGTFDDACGWITRACGRRLTTAARLRVALADRKKARWRTELDEILAAAGSGVHSALEYRYLRDVERAHGLPRSRRQVRVVVDGVIAYRDVYYEEYRLAVELDGRLAHPDDERWRDQRRDNVSRAHGVQTVRYGWRDLYCQPCETAALQARILRQLGWAGTARPCSPGCPVRELETARPPREPENARPVRERGAARPLRERGPPGRPEPVAGRPERGTGQRRPVPRGARPESRPDVAGRVNRPARLRV
jgi:predicted transcriptional regulator of viral defense system